MPLTPEDVQNKRFTVVRFKTGYDEEEVDNFLDEVEEEIRRLAAANRSLNQAAFRSPDAPSPTAVLPPAPVPTPVAPPAPVTPSLPPMPARVLDDHGDPALRTLMIAQRTAEEAITKAHADADAIVRAGRAKVAAMEQEVRNAHASRLAALELERTGLIEEIAALRGFEREFRARLRSYISSSMADLDARPGILPAPELPVPVVPPGTVPATGRHAADRPTGELPTADPVRPAAQPAPRPPVPAPAPAPVLPVAPPAAPTAPPGFVSRPAVPPSGPPVQA